MSKTHWEQDQIRYSDVEVRYAVNQVLSETSALWIWPFRNVRFWFQERMIKELESYKPQKKANEAGE